MRLEDALKPHNKETYKKIEKTLRLTNKTCIIQPTGSGKSYLILKLIEDYVKQNRHIIVIEPQKYIFDQLQDKMRKYGLLSNKVKFITYSALGKMDNNKIKQFTLPNLVIIDEMHRAGAPIWGSGLQKMFNIFPQDCKYVGFSATPIRFLDGKRNMAEELFDGCIANEIGLADAILDRLLPLPRYIAGLYTYDNEFNSITRRIQNSRNTFEKKKKLLEEVAVMKRNLDKSKGISDLFKQYINEEKGKFIAFCQNIKHLKLMKSHLEEWFSQAGLNVNIYEVHCKNPQKDNQFNTFMEDDGLSVCLSVAMLSEGVHGIDGVILLRDTVSPNLYYQQIGRVFAVDMGRVPIIFDLVANCESVMDCNLKNDLLKAINRRIKEKNDNTISNDGDDIEGITAKDIEEFFIFDQVLDAINTFKSIEEHLKMSNDNNCSNDEWGDDKKILIEYFPKIGLNVKEMLSKRRSSQSIIAKAYNLGLIENEWTDNKIEILRKNYVIYGASGTKKKFLTEMSAQKIRKMACELGLVYKGNMWEEESKVFLIENYGKMSKHELSKRLNRTERSICAMAHRLKLKKSNIN